MSQQTAITLNAIVYNPAGTKDGKTSWVSRTAGVAAGFSRLFSTFKDSVNAATQTKVTYELAIPVVSVADTECSCAGTLLRTSSVQINAWLAPGSTLAERTDLYLRLKDLVGDTSFQAAVKDLNPSYG